jgi:hypothetical protein
MPVPLGPGVISAANTGSTVPSITLNSAIGAQSIQSAGTATLTIATSTWSGTVHFYESNDGVTLTQIDDAFILDRTLGIYGAIPSGASNNTYQVTTSAGFVFFIASALASGSINVNLSTGSGAIPPPSSAVTGTVAVSNLPATQTVAGTVAVSNLPATQAVSGAVAVSNLPATQTVAGSVAVSNLPATQTVAGTVAVSNLPAPQTVATDISGSLTTGGTAQTLYGGVTPAHGYEIINIDPTNTLWVCDNGGTAAPNSPGSFQLFYLGQSYSTPPGMIPQGHISVYGATTGQQWTGRVW